MGAAKIMSKLDDEDGACNFSIMREVQILRRVKGCNSFVQMQEIAVTKKGESVIVMEFCHSSLEGLLRSDKHVLFAANVGRRRVCLFWGDFVFICVSLLSLLLLLSP